MIIVSGENQDHQLGVDWNNKAIDGTMIVSPPDYLKLDTSSLLSLSVYSSHTVWITRDGKAHAIGDKKAFEINKSLPENDLKQSSIFEIHDEEGNNCVFLSAVCGFQYTLFLVQPISSNDYNQLIYSHSSDKNNQFFIDISGRNPIALFGGHTVSGAIDSKGDIIIITDPLSPQILALPSKEKCVQLACGNRYICALSSSGQVYMSYLNPDTDLCESFTLVKELQSTKIIHITGTHHHFLAISSLGITFARGRNTAGCLGTGQGIKKTKKFVRVTPLLNCKIISAFAGCDHSLFLTAEEGRVIACGNNCFGQIPIDKGPTEEDFYLPIFTSIRSRSSFSIAGEHMSLTFVDCKPPPNIPNKIVRKGMPVAPSLKRDLTKFMSIITITEQAAPTPKESEQDDPCLSHCCIII